MKRNVETPTSRPILRVGKPQGELWAERDRMLEEANAGCNEPDTGRMPGPKGSQRPAGAPVRESLKNRLREGKRWTAARAAGALSTHSWSAINWKQVQAEVWRLQVRIAQAVREGRRGRVRSLQRLLVRSRAAKLCCDFDSGAGEHVHRRVDAEEFKPPSHQVVMRGCVTPSSWAALAWVRPWS